MCNMRMNNKVSKQQAHKKGTQLAIQIDILFAFHLMTDDKRQPADNRQPTTYNRQPTTRRDDTQPQCW